MRPRVKLRAAVLMTYRVSYVTMERDCLDELSNLAYIATLRTAPLASKYALSDIGCKQMCHLQRVQCVCTALIFGNIYATVRFHCLELQILLGDKA